MNSRRLKGMILAAGLGTRLLPLTKDRPKPLMEALGRPLIDYVLSGMHGVGVESIVINTHYLSKQIMDYVGKSYRGIPIHWLYEPEILGTGGALKNARALLQCDNCDVLLQNADIFIDINLKELIEYHRRESALATLVLKTVDNPRSFGAVGTDKRERIRSLVNFVDYQGPVLKERMFCGTHVLSNEAFEAFPSQDAFSIIDAFYAPLISQGQKIMAFDLPGYYCDTGRPEDLFSLNMRLLKQTAQSYWQGENVQIKTGAKIGSNVVLGKHVIIEDGVQIDNAIVMSHTQVSRDHVSHGIISGCESISLGQNSDLCRT